MDVSVIIVTYNTCEMTINCINSVIQKTENLDYEIILVDNASQDESYSTFSQDARIRYIYSEKIWDLVKLIIWVLNLQKVDIFFY